jgi:hypothetical protein
MGTAQPTSAPADRGLAVAACCDDLRRVALARGADHIADKLAAAAARAKRPSTVVCITGDFKAGKTSLVNALVGTTACPVDPVLATATLTLVHAGQELAARARTRRDGRATYEPVESDALPDLLWERAGPAPPAAADRVDIAVPSPFLERGVLLVDTPGVGGLSGGGAAALAFVPFADAVVLVADARAPLTDAEVRFAREAAARCGSVICCVTKRDLWPQWRETVAANAARLAAAGLSVPVVASSSMSDGGIADLAEALESHVLGVPRQLILDRTVSDAGACMRALDSAVRAELDTLADPSRTERHTIEVTAARDNVERLRGPAARWQSVLNDQVTDLSNELTHSLRSDLRRIAREVDDALERAHDTGGWDAVAAQLRMDIAGAVERTEAQLLARASAIETELFGLLQQDGVNVEGIQARLVVDIDLPHRSTDEHGVARRVGQGANQAIDALRGASGGLMCLGLLQSLLPAAGAVVVLANPVAMAGIGLWSGARTVLEQRKRRTAVQRQEARIAVRQVLDETQAELMHQLGESVRAIQRQVRDSVTATLTDLLASANADLARAQANAAGSTADLAARRTNLSESLAALDRASTRLTALSTPSPRQAAS